MKKSIVIFVCFLSIVSSKAQKLYTVASSKVEFTSDAALEVIEANSDELKGLLNLEDNYFAFRVQMTSFQGFNSELQQTHFNENYMESSKFPYTLFDGKILDDIDLTKAGTYQVQGKGKFTCHGVSIEKTMDCEIVVTEDKIKVNSKFNVLLKDHNIKIPTVVNMKVAEEIFVTVNIELVPKK